MTILGKTVNRIKLLVSVLIVSILVKGLLLVLDLPFLGERTRAVKEMVYQERNPIRVPYAGEAIRRDQAVLRNRYVGSWQEIMA